MKSGINNYIKKGGKKLKQYRIDESKRLEFGFYTLGDHLPNPATRERISAQERIHEIIDYAKLAESSCF